MVNNKLREIDIIGIDIMGNIMKTGINICHWVLVKRKQRHKEIKRSMGKNQISC